MNFKNRFFSEIKRNAVLFAIAMALLAATSYAASADVSGVWTFSLTAPNGLTSEPVVKLNQDGEALTGTYSGRFGDSPAAGSMKGHNVNLDVTTSAGKLHFSGTLDIAGNKISGSYELAGQGEGAFSAQRKRVGSPKKAETAKTGQ